MNDFISVIVCTYNREKYIGRCLEHLLRQHPEPSSYEVLIIDNNSTDRTREICSEFVNRHGEIFRYIMEQSQGLSFARNRGIKEARGSLLVFLDDDAFADVNYIASTRSYFASHPDVLAAGGRIHPQYEDSEPTWMTSFLLPLVAAQDMGDDAVPFKKGRFPIGANMIIRKKAFETYGIFNTGLGRKGSSLEGGEEKDFIQRLHAAHERIMFTPQASVTHIIPPQRVQPDYIRRQAIGVGRSERRRLSTNGAGSLLTKILEESIKGLGTIFLFFGYLLAGKPSAGWMLVRFRCWVFKGLLFS